MSKLTIKGSKGQILPDNNFAVDFEPKYGTRKDSIMEERAKKFDYFSQFSRALPLPETTDEVKNEINYLSKRMSTISSEIRSATEALTSLQKEFTFYANYKYALEKTISPLTLITSPSQRKKKKESLFEKLQALSPERQVKLKKFMKEEG